MERPTVDLIIPIQQESLLLTQCVDAIHKNTKNFRLHICRDPDLNVSEARQQALNTLRLGQYVCFLDDDTLVQQPDWIDNMIMGLQNNPHAAIAFAEEQWGDTDHIVNIYQEGQTVKYGPAACMLIDRNKIPISVRWDKYMGLRTGWLGGDFEEVDYCAQVWNVGLECIGIHNSRFKHMDRTTMDYFRTTDRAKTCAVMKFLLQHKHTTCPDNNEYFRKLKYVKASTDNDRMLAPGSTLKECFSGVIKDNHIEHFTYVKVHDLV
jgi:glycosyltransferase involved in cell wall biosynthesis